MPVDAIEHNKGGPSAEQILEMASAFWISKESLNNLSPTERAICAIAPENEGIEAPQLSVNDSAIPNGQRKRKQVEGEKENRQEDLEHDVRVFNKLVLNKATISERECKRQADFLKNVLIKKERRTFGDITAVMQWITDGNYPGEVRSIHILKSSVFDQALDAIAEAEEEAAKAEARRQARAEWEAADEARRVREDEDYLRQQQVERQLVQVAVREVPRRLPAVKVVESEKTAAEKAAYTAAKEAHYAAVRAHARRFREWLEAGRDEDEFVRNNPAPVDPTLSKSCVSIGEGMAAVMVNLRKNWTTAEASA